jgi:hypothetical protein
MKITRVITYEGSADQLLNQLSKSFHDGLHEFGDIKISVVTLDDAEAEKIVPIKLLLERKN